MDALDRYLFDLPLTPEDERDLLLRELDLAYAKREFNRLRVQFVNNLELMSRKSRVNEFMDGVAKGDVLEVLEGAIRTCTGTISVDGEWVIVDLYPAVVLKQDSMIIQVFTWDLYQLCKDKKARLKAG